MRLNKDVAAFSYIWIMSIVVFAARKHSSFAQFHSRQGLILFVLSFVWLIPWVGQYLELLVVAGMVLGFIHAAQGSKSDVPFIGLLSRGELHIEHIAEAILKPFEKTWVEFRAKKTTPKKPILDRSSDPPVQ